MIKYAQVQALRKKAESGFLFGPDYKLPPLTNDTDDYRNGYSDGIVDGRYDGWNRSRDRIHDDIGHYASIGAPIGAVAGTGISALLLRKDMSNAKKLAILLAGAGIGGAAGAGIGGTLGGLGIRNL